MVIHHHYRTTVTQLNAINTVVDYIRTVYGHGLEVARLERALKILEARAHILRARAAHNHSCRRRRKETNWLSLDSEAHLKTGH